MYKQTEINNEALNADAKLAAEKGPKNPFLKAFKQYYWQMGLVFTLLLFFVIIEIRHPYMFLQDDNRDLGLPNFVHAYRSLMNGESALFNFHQYLGTPFMAMGQWLVFHYSIYIILGVMSLYYPPVTIQLHLGLITFHYMVVLIMDYQLNTTKPLFFRRSDETSNGIESKINTNSIELKVNNKQEDEIYVLFLYNKLFKAKIDGKDVQINRDDFGRMLIKVPEGQHNVIIRYTEPYMLAGFVIMILTISGSITLWMIYRRRNMRVFVNGEKEIQQ